jgi:mycofactocin precursor
LALGANIVSRIHGSRRDGGAVSDTLVRERVEEPVEEPVDTGGEIAVESLIEDISIDGMCGVY